MDPKECKQLAESLFPGTPEIDHEIEYPKRDLPPGAAVTRLGPSPTGFIHIGNLYTAFMNQKIANETGGVFILRIEDTDSKREVAGAAGALIRSLQWFGVNFDEGVCLEAGTDKLCESGKYGPYKQSDRKAIYHDYARRLVESGLAYPCFLTEDEIGEIRSRQEAQKLTPGIYGQWAKYRDCPADTYMELLRAGRPWALRFRAGQEDREIKVCDGIRGDLIMPGNKMDFILLKSDGMPTYHFAHVIDDHLMRTTHVIRGEEWISSLPVHVDIFQALGFDIPLYCHSTVLMKINNGKKRKLSKRSDPEISLDYYKEEGYHPKAILEYLLTVINSNFEEWRQAHPDASIDDFEMTTDKMSVSGILFDLDKLNDISKDILVRMPAGELADFLIDWAKLYDSDAYGLLSADRELLSRILDIGRDGDKPRKDLSHGLQMWDFIKYFYREHYERTGPWPENVPEADVPALIGGYLDTYDHDADREQWFDKIRELSEANGYAARPKDFKKNPEMYKGHVGDVSTVIRLAVVGRATSPDLYEIQQILGENEVRSRLNSALF